MRILCLDYHNPYNNDRHDDMMDTIAKAVYPDIPKILCPHKTSDCKRYLSDSVQNKRPYDLLVICADPKDEPLFYRFECQRLIRFMLHYLRRSTPGYNIPVVVLNMDKQLDINRHNMSTIHSLKELQTVITNIQAKKSEVTYYA